MLIKLKKVLKRCLKYPKGCARAISKIITTTIKEKRNNTVECHQNNPYGNV